MYVCNCVPAPGLNPRGACGHPCERRLLLGVHPPTPTARRRAPLGGRDRSLGPRPYSSSSDEPSKMARSNPREGRDSSASGGGMGGGGGGSAWPGGGGGGAAPGGSKLLRNESAVWRTESRDSSSAATVSGHFPVLFCRLVDTITDRRFSFERGPSSAGPEPPTAETTDPPPLGPGCVLAAARTSSRGCTTLGAPHTHESRVTAEFPEYQAVGYTMVQMFLLLSC